MRQLHENIKAFILRVIDFFYPLFKRVMPLQTFRYAVCGGGNTALNLLIFAASYNYLFQKQVVYLPLGMAMEPHIAAYALAFMVTFPSGFYLSMFVVFPESHLRRRIQLFRYLLVVLGSVILNYVLLKTFVEVFHWYPTPSMILNTILVVTFSYVSQRYFSFRTKKTLNQEV